MKTLALKISGLFLLLVFHPGLWAAEAVPSGYVGLGFGAAKIDDLDTSIEDENCADVIAFGGTCSVSSDDSDTGYKIFGGWKVNPNFSVELSYVDLGEATIDYSESIFGTTLVEAFAAEITGFGTFPLFPLDTWVG